MSVLQRMEVLDKLHGGMRTAVVTCRYSVHDSMLHYIKKIETKSGNFHSLLPNSATYTPQ